jgi:hypothetical protein
MRNLFSEAFPFNVTASLLSFNPFSLASKRIEGTNEGIKIIVLKIKDKYQ